MYYFHYTDKTTESERLSDLLNTMPTIGAKCNYKVHANTRPLHTAAGLIDSSVLHPAFASQGWGKLSYSDCTAAPAANQRQCQVCKGPIALKNKVHVSTYVFKLLKKAWGMTSSPSWQEWKNITEDMTMFLQSHCTRWARVYHRCTPHTHRRQRLVYKESCNSHIVWDVGRPHDWCILSRSETKEETKS